MRHLFYTGVVSLVVLAVPPAAAAEDEIIVTATRTPTPRDHLPAHITVIDVNSARGRGALTLDQALSEVPGIQALRSGPLGQQASIFSGGFESNHTLVLFDGVRIDDPSTPEGIFDAGQDSLGGAARLEVVSGPMSALYGSGALGGVINIVPMRGGDRPVSPHLEFASGSFGTIAANAGADGALGRLRYAISVDSFATEGFDVVPSRIAAHTGEKDGAESTVLTGVFDLAVNNVLSLDLLLRQRDARADFDPGFFGDIGENPEAEISQNDVSLWRLGTTLTLTPRTALRLSGGRLDTDRVVTDLGVTGDEYHGERQFADALATWRGDAGLLNAGASYEDEAIDAVSFGSTIAGGQRHLGAFATVQATLGAAHIVAALRRDDYEGFGGETTGRMGGAFHVTPGARIFASYGTSFRAPSLYERFVPFFGAAGLRPERAESWEIGAESRWVLFGQENGVEARLIYRSSEIEDLIGFAGFTYANVDRAEIDFAESRLALRPLPWLTARVAYANTRAVDAEFDTPLQRRPRHAWSAELEAARGPFSAQIAWREVGSRLDTVYANSGAFTGVERVAAYDLIQASVSWRQNDRATLYVAANNVADETYEPANGFAGEPANVLVGLRLTP